MNGARPAPGFGKSRRAERRRAKVGHRPGRCREGGRGEPLGRGQNPGKGGCRDTLEGRKIVLRGSGEANSNVVIDPVQIY